MVCGVCGVCGRRECQLQRRRRPYISAAMSGQADRERPGGGARQRGACCMHKAIPKHHPIRAAPRLLECCMCTAYNQHLPAMQTMHAACMQEALGVHARAQPAEPSDGMPCLHDCRLQLLGQACGRRVYAQGQVVLLRREHACDVGPQAVREAEGAAVGLEGAVAAVAQAERALHLRLRLRPQRMAVRMAAWCRASSGSGSQCRRGKRNQPNPPRRW